MSTTLKPLVLIVLAAILGCMLGVAFPDKISFAAPISKILIGLIKMAATPLIFFAILETVLSHSIAKKDFLKLLLVVGSNAIAAILIGLSIANIFKPGKSLSPLIQSQNSINAKSNFDLLAAIKQQIPSSLVQPFLDNDIMATVILALLLAFALKKSISRNDQQQILTTKTNTIIKVLRESFEIVLSWIVSLVPIIVFASCAQIASKHGLQSFKGLFHFLVFCLLGMLLQAFIVYSLWLTLVAKISLSRFWSAAITPATYAFSVNSSLVALPFTIKALDKLGVSRRASTLSACIGTNLNNDGIVLFEGFALIALTQALSMDLSLTSQIYAALFCIISALGVAGVPEAGVIALTLVLSVFGIPSEVIAILFAVDWIIARTRSALNCSADMVGAVVLNKIL